MMDSAQYRRIIQGRRNKYNGREFESIIETACDYYNIQGIAKIEKTPEPMKPIKDLGNGKFIAHYEKKAQPDFKGTLRTGRSVVFDAKHTDTDRIQQSVISDEQEKDLNEHESYGAYCFVLVSFSFERYYKIPWQTFKNMKTIYGRKYVKPEDIKEYRVPYVGGILRFLT